MVMVMQPLLTERAAAALLCLSIRSLQRLRQSGAGPKFVRVGKSAIRYRTGDLEGYVAGRVVSSTSVILKTKTAA
jgi:hypothetical protein